LEGNQHVKLLKTGLALSMVGVGLAAMPSLGAQALPAPAASDDGLRAMTNQADGAVAISAESATGKVGFIRVKDNGDLLPGREASSAATAASKAGAYLAEFASNFGARPDELQQSSIAHNKFGWTVTYRQAYRGVPVFGGTLKANVDAAGDLTSVNGFAAPGLNLSVTPGRTAADAAARAVSTVIAHPPTTEEGKPADLKGLRAADTGLVVYRIGSVKGEAGKAILAYQVAVTNVRANGTGGSVRDVVLLDANTLKPVNRYSTVNDSLSRDLYEADANRNLTKVWTEGDPLLPDPAATVNEDQDSMVKSTGDSYWLYFNTFGRDSYDDAGAKMVTINNDPAIRCPNANWNGSTTNYCDGVSSDDVVSHEWGHAYTEYTSGLIYQWQSGALNEAYSDIWGETIDLINGRLDEGEGDLTVKRPVGQCSTHSPANPLLTINSPAAVAKDCATAGAAFGPELSGTGLTGDVVLGLDADENAGAPTDDPANPFDTGGSAYDGCSTPFSNAADVAGKIVMVNRGLCGFEAKARNAEANGAIGVIIGNRNPGEVFAMSGDAGADPTISTVMIDRVDRTAIANALATDTVNITMKDASGDRFDSYRWLMGEKSEAFGGAIRDMWTPTCYGDPGKVSDAEYKCSADDNGGVHGNSGVPNHGYALLVDGGDYNGHDVTGIGLDKAANIYFKAQTDYLTEVSDFSDHADSLEAACAALINKPIVALDTAANADLQLADRITAEDCDQVTAMIAAVELRLDPTSECGWEPILATTGEPTFSCGTGTTTSTLFSDDFEAGLAKWTADSESVYGGPTSPWEGSTTAPGGHAGGTAFAPDPSDGSCAKDTDDISGRDSMVSPSIVVPATGTAPRLSFDHYVRTEAGFDGGNVKLKVNGGAFAVIPAAAFDFNPYNGTMEIAPGNTSPMAGEAAFTGTNPGSAFGSWGTSHVDLAAAGVKAGDTVQLRFDSGRDGCGGVEGWYVDNVKVSICTPTPTPTPTTTPTTTATPTTTPTATPTPAAKSATVTKVTVKPSTVKRGAAFKVIVKVTSDAGTVTGRIKLLIDGHKLDKATLKDGKAVIKVQRMLALGKHKVTAKYLGTDKLSRSQDDARMRIVG
jgi:Zn-dependent metalloprotease